jgi:hypothetical protein
MTLKSEAIPVEYGDLSVHACIAVAASGNDDSLISKK